MQVTHSEGTRATATAIIQLEDGWIVTDAGWPIPIVEPPRLTVPTHPCPPRSPRRGRPAATSCEALRLLLKGEGYDIETAASPAAVLAALRGARLRRRPDGPQLRPRHDLGPRGPRRCSRGMQALDATLPAVVMTAWGSVEQRGRGDAPRRARLHREAVGQRAAARHAAHPGRAGPGAPAQPAAGEREPAAPAATGRPTLVAESRRHAPGARS